jgi:Mg2+ and Co2+ transporter CorA
MCEYIKARLGQIEWQLGFPEQFGTGMSQNLINQSVKRLHAWRRLIPLYREMLTEISEPVAMAGNLVAHETTLLSDTGITIQSQTPPEKSTLDSIISDFEKVSRQMKELQDRTDRLTSVLMAAISIEDSRRGLQENQNVARLTWLATVFIPLTFITGLFSMTQDISSLKFTFGWYFAAAIPVTALALGLAMNISLLPLPRLLLPKSHKTVGPHD